METGEVNTTKNENAKSAAMAITPFCGGLPSAVLKERLCHETRETQGTRTRGVAFSNAPARPQRDGAPQQTGLQDVLLRANARAAGAVVRSRSHSAISSARRQPSRATRAVAGQRTRRPRGLAAGALN